MGKLNLIFVPLLLLVCLCCLTSAKKGPGRIVGGKPIIPYSYPSYISIEKSGFARDPANGVLIHPLWVLSTAFAIYPPCTLDLYAADFIEGETEGPEQRRMSSCEWDEGVFYHPKYDYYTNDMAVTTFVASQEPFEINDKVQIVSLATDRYPLPASAILVAHGVVDGELNWNSTVMEVSLPIVDFETCHENWAQIDRDRFVTSRTLCAGSDSDDDGERNGCIGDYGGPLYDVSKGRQILLGLLTIQGCNFNPDLVLPTVFMRTSKFIGWVESCTRLCFEEEGHSGVGKFVEYSKDVQDADPYQLEIFSDLADSICMQYLEYNKTGSIPDPIKTERMATIGWSWFRKRNCSKSDANCYPFTHRRC